MNLFNNTSNATTSEHLQRLKKWVNELLMLDGHVPISISQLQCHELDCPPVETIIAVMTQPTQTFKIHQPVMEIDYPQLKAALALQ